jgi:hypothetical protein
MDIMLILHQNHVLNVMILVPPVSDQELTIVLLVTIHVDFMETLVLIHAQMVIITKIMYVHNVMSLVKLVMDHQDSNVIHATKQLT